MRIALISNWGSTNCGVANFGRDFASALVQAGHEVLTSGWRDPRDLPVDRVLVNWDSGTLPQDASTLYGSASIFVHHTYRGAPTPLPEPPHLLLSPMAGYGHYFPYPVPAAPPPTTIIPKTLGVTTLRKEGCDYLQAAAARAGLQLCLPDRWRSTEEEVARLAACELLALWYTDSPGRSLALATALAARRPLLLSHPSRMFEYADKSAEPYWVNYSNQDLTDLVQWLGRMHEAVEAGEARIPTTLAEGWTWPKAIQRLEALWM